MIVQLKPKFYKRWLFAFILGMIAGPIILFCSLLLIENQQYIAPRYWVGRINGDMPVNDFSRPVASTIPSYFELREPDGNGNFVSTDLNSKYLINTEVKFDHGAGMPFLTIAFNDQGEQLLTTITARNVGKQIGFFVDGKMLYTPTVAQVITVGSLSLKGGLSIKDAQSLAQSLNAGRGMTQGVSDIVK